MPKGVSIHIGVNDPKNSGPKEKLNACDKDAVAMEKLAKDAGFQTTLLVDEDATVANVLKAIDDSVDVVGNDGILMLTFSGHGDVVGDVSGDEEDGNDERWCLADDPMLDDTLFEQWKKFHKGARILVISDSCHSGDIFLAPSDPSQPASDGLLADAAGDAAPGGAGELGATKAAAAPAGRTAKLRELASVQASVLLLAASSEDLTAKEGDDHGVYTGALLEVWNGGSFQGDYVKLHDTIFDALRPDQFPVIRHLISPSFMHQRPFTI